MHADATDAGRHRNGGGVREQLADVGQAICAVEDES